MVKYCGYYITCQEVPDEIALTLTITRCLHRCPGCHSPWLREDFGDELTPTVLNGLIDNYEEGITCVCFMGVGDEPTELDPLIRLVHERGLKVCVYDGDDAGEFLSYELESGNQLFFPDYYKYGSYKKELGGLASPDTNQRMLKLCHGGIYINITSWFWRKHENE